MLEILLEAQEVIHKDIDLNQVDEPSDYDALLALIEQRVIELLDTDDRLLFSYLYRLDISELHLRQVMSNHDMDKIQAISKLILERQIQRVQTKKRFPQKPLDGWEW